MDGRKRTITKRSLAVGLAAAAQIVWIAPCHGQATPSSPPRASSSVNIPPPTVRQGTVDAELIRSGHHAHASSQQAYSPPAPPKPAPPSAPPAAPPSAPPAAPPTFPSFAPPTTAYAPGYSAPYAPQYAMVPVMPQFAPPPAAAPPPSGNFFLPNAAPPAFSPPVAPAYAMPAMAPAFAMPMAPQPAAVGTGTGLVGSSVSVPTSTSSTSVEIRGPGLLSAGLARLGSRLVLLGRTRVRTVQETVLQTPQAQPFGGSATIATTGTTPIQPPAAPPAAPPVREEAPPPSAPTPSPQGEQGHHGHSLMQHLFGHK